MLDYVFLEEAETDFDDAVAYLNINYPAITESFIIAVKDAINDIREFPGWWPVWPETEDWPEWEGEFLNAKNDQICTVSLSFCDPRRRGTESPRHSGVSSVISAISRTLVARSRGWLCRQRLCNR